MTTVSFFKQDGLFTGFSAKGHSTATASDDDGRLVCAAVSSAVIMTANTLTDVLCLKADIQTADGLLKLKLLSGVNSAQSVIKGLYIHIEELSRQYPDNLKIITEV